MSHLPFDLCVNKLGTRLFGVTTISLAEIVQTHTYQDTFRGIAGNDHKRNGRTDEEIRNDVARGKAAEVGVAKLLATDVFDEEWIKNDRSTYSKDVVYDGVRIEVKSHFSKGWFKIPLESYTTMINNRKVEGFDVLLFARVTDHAEGVYLVKPTLVVDPYPESAEFQKLWDIFDGEHKTPAKVYRADLAWARNICFSYSETIVG